MNNCIPDEVLAVEVLPRFPGVVLVAVPFPFDEVLESAPLEALADDFLDYVVVVFRLFHKLNSIKRFLHSQEFQMPYG